MMDTLGRVILFIRERLFSLQRFKKVWASSLLRASKKCFYCIVSFTTVTVYTVGQ